jgi:uncharacterized membrane protein
MEQVIEKKEELPKEQIKTNEENHFKILGITFWRLFAYFIIYSIIGFVIETLFGMAKYGMLESRQSFLYGPFCAIYGVGAIIMILSLQYFKKSYNSLFIGGCIVGSVTEYLVSWIGEAILHLKWWDYSKMPFNINGRICLLYAVFWGFLGLYLMISLNPKIDRLINFIKSKISINLLQIFVVLCTIFMFVDCVSTAFALSFFTVRTIKEKNIPVSNQEYVDKAYENIYNNEFKVKLINKFFNDEKMLKTFPRLTVEDSSGNIIRVSTLYPDIKTYFYKFGGGEEK